MRRRQQIRSAAIRAGLVTVAFLAVVGMAYLGSRPKKSSSQPVGGKAPAFALPSSDGRQVSLESFRGKKVFLYFSEGIGCDACFTQVVELERQAKELEKAGITLVPIVINSPRDVAREMERFGIHTPFLSDTTKSVSREYDVLGKGMHSDMPGHSFVLVDEQGMLRWHMDYPSMFVETKQLLSDAGIPA